MRTKRFNIIFFCIFKLVFRQPVLMTCLGAILIDRGATAVEVGYLALILRRYQFGRERQADG